MDKAYSHREYEDKIYRLWEKSKAFTPRKDRKKKPFTIIMPPPNANGSLHIGHAMFVTLEDIMVRFRRMKGEPTLMLPGADHAGILTQVVFERKLKKEGKSRYDLGREKFYRQCYKFTQENKKIMYSQIKKLGASCDWTREKFTLDPVISEEVLKTFVELYKDGLAYRDERMINWCPRCATALSDLEVEHENEKTSLWFIKYPLKTHSAITGDERFLMVATTRPETMLGDMAIAVSHKDFRYRKFVGQKAIVPIVNREVPVIADSAVDPDFGTGAVKVTPAHDPVDWEIGRRHKLASIQVVGFNNRMTEAAGKEFAGLKVQEARKKIIEILKKKDYLINEKRYEHAVTHCERCKTMIEPQVSLQWFINTNLKFKMKNEKLRRPLGVKGASLREIGYLVVKKGLIKIIPRRFAKNYLRWMRDLHDWCVSRQIWWGHRLPIWYCGLSGLSGLQKMMNPEFMRATSGKLQVVRNGCGNIIVSLKKPGRCPKCGKRNIIQDPDTFDTWFSSGQWGYTTLGFKKAASSKQQAARISDFNYFYPTSVMETGYEILPIWVAKMIMLGLYRTGEIPFRTVYLHGLVRDAFGEKMSKSKGNVINPLDVIEKFGADALRMALVVGASPGNDISLGEPKIKGYRNFTNKVWNISRFFMMNLPNPPAGRFFYTKEMKGLVKEDKEIIKKLNDLIKGVTKDLEEYKFSSAGETIYRFVWHELADSYIETVKERLKKKDVVALSVLDHVLRNCLKLLHPFMPFVTEAIWQMIPRKTCLPAGRHKDPLIISSWPET